MTSSVLNVPSGITGAFAPSAAGSSEYVLTLQAGETPAAEEFAVTVVESYGGTTYNSTIEVQAAACVPITCAHAGAICGPMANGCGGTLECGVCGLGLSCSDGMCTRPGSGGPSCPPHQHCW